MRIRYAVTHSPTLGVRVLCFANQGWHFFDTPDRAKSWLTAIKASWESNFGRRSADSLRVKEIRCYDNGDSMATYWLERYDPALLQELKTELKDVHKRLKSLQKQAVVIAVSKRVDQKLRQVNLVAQRDLNLHCSRLEKQIQAAIPEELFKLI